jgi:hypothetical protein
VSGTIAALGLLAAAISPIPLPATSGVDLSYQRPLGQVAEYRLSVDVRGEQISLDERRPVRIRAEVEYVEEVVAQEQGGVARVQASVRRRRTLAPGEVDASGGLAAARADLAGPWFRRAVLLADDAYPRETELRIVSPVSWRVARGAPLEITVEAARHVPPELTFHFHFPSAGDADETVATTEEEVLAFLTEKKHPVLEMDPLM